MKRLTPDGYGSISAGEVLPLREAARRLGWGQRTVRKAQADGLRTIQYGKLKYCIGCDVVTWFKKLAEQTCQNQAEKIE